MQEKYQQAAYLHILGQYDSALALYSEIQKENETYELLISKSVALISLNKYESAIQNCDLAIKSDDKQSEAYYRKGQAQFYLGQFNDAKLNLEKANSLLQKNPITTKKILAWISKCDSELNNVNLAGLIEQGGVALGQKINQKTEEVKKDIPVVKQAQKITYTWYQTESKITIEVQYSLSNASKLNADIQKNTIHVSFPTSDSSEYNLDLNLFAEILPETQNVTVYSQQIQITVDKKDSKLNWNKLTGDVKIETPELKGVDKKEEKKEDKKVEKKQEQNVRKPLANPPAQQPLYPTSSKVKKNWDKINADIEEDYSKHKDEYAEGDPMNDVFKTIYANADEDTRRAMVKSYQTSGGTVLSTDWKDVKSKDYEGKDRPSPPKGQKEHKWEK